MKLPFNKNSQKALRFALVMGAAASAIVVAATAGDPAPQKDAPTAAQTLKR